MQAISLKFMRMKYATLHGNHFRKRVRKTSEKHEILRNVLSFVEGQAKGVIF